MNLKEIMENKLESKIECVILLNGNFIPVRIFKSKMTEFNNLLLEKVSKVDAINSPFISLSGAMIKADTIVGWYFREIIQSPTDKVIEFMEKKLPDNEEGNEWKNG